VGGWHRPAAEAPAREPGWWARLGDTEPIRRALWPVAVAIVTLLGGYGILTERTGALWLGLAAAILSAGGGELARGIAWAPGSVDERDLEWFARLDAWRDYEYERGVADGQGMGDEPGEHAAPDLPAPATEQIRAVRPTPPPSGRPPV
jgi:hypothetical protein